LSTSFLAREKAREKVNNQFVITHWELTVWQTKLQERTAENVAAQQRRIHLEGIRWQIR
jgi:hypothetical protein